MAEIPKRLYRSRKEKVIAGVCGGIAEYFNIDPTFVRLIFIVFCFLGLGLSLIVYLIAWAIIPVAPDTMMRNEPPK